MTKREYSGRQMIADDILETALRKWEKIIEREGDANGERLKYSYFKKILQETAREHAMSEILDGRNNIDIRKTESRN